MLDALGNGDRLGLVLDALEDHDELVAAEPRDDVAGPHAAVEAARDETKQRVARVMAERVVDDLEAVAVEEEHAELLLAVALGARDRSPQEVRGITAVRQRGQGVELRLAPQALLEILSRGDVGHRAGDAQRAPFGVAHDDAAAEHPDEESLAVAEAVLAVEVRSRPGGLRGDIHLELRQVAQVDPAEPLLGAQRKCAVHHADHLPPALGEVDLAGDEVPVPEPVVRTARGEGVALLALAERKLHLAALLDLTLEMFVRVLELDGALEQTSLQFLEPPPGFRFLGDARAEVVSRPQRPPDRRGAREQREDERNQLHVGAPWRAVADTLLALDRVADVQQDLEVELFAAIGEVERRHLRVVARDLGTFERLAVHLIEVGENAIAGSGHAFVLQNVCSESGRLEAGGSGRAGLRGGSIEQEFLGGAKHQPARIERRGHRPPRCARRLATDASSCTNGRREATTSGSLSPSTAMRAGG